MVKEAIRTANLSKRYGTKNVVNNLNLSIKSGEIVGFLQCRSRYHGYGLSDGEKRSYKCKIGHHR